MGACGPGVQLRRRETHRRPIRVETRWRTLGQPAARQVTRPDTTREYGRQRNQTVPTSRPAWCRLHQPPGVLPPGVLPPGVLPPGVLPPGAGDGVGTPPPVLPPLLGPELLLPVPSPVWPPTGAFGPGIAPQPKTEASGETGPAPVALPELEFPADGSLVVCVADVVVMPAHVVVAVEVVGEGVVLPQPASASTATAITDAAAAAPRCRPLGTGWRELPRGRRNALAGMTRSLPRTLPTKKNTAT